jgi:hypothetical protein
MTNPGLWHGGQPPPFSGFDYRQFRPSIYCPAWAHSRSVGFDLGRDGVPVVEALAVHRYDLAVGAIYVVLSAAVTEGLIAASANAPVTNGAVGHRVGATR